MRTYDFGLFDEPDYSQFPPEMTTYLEGLILETTQVAFEKNKAGGLHASGPVLYD